MKEEKVKVDIKRETEDKTNNELLQNMPMTDILSMAQIDMCLPQVGTSTSIIRGQRGRSRNPTKLLRPKDWREKRRRQRLAAKKSRRQNRQ